MNCMCEWQEQYLTSRGIEWALRVFASTRAVRLFLRVRAVVKFVLQAASTVENTDCELGALRKFSARRNPSFIKRKRFAPSNLAVNH